MKRRITKKFKTQLNKIKNILIPTGCYHRFSIEDVMTTDNPSCMYCGETKEQIMLIEKIREI